MGSNQSVCCQQIQAHIEHIKFKNAKIFSLNSVPKLSTQLAIQQKTYKQWQKQLHSYQLNQQFLMLPESSDYKNQGLCSGIGSVKIVYENFPYLLKNEIHDRAGKKQTLTEQQLWFLLFAIFSAKKQFTTQKINQGNLGSVTPDNIFLSQKGEIKVGNILSWPGEQQTMQKIISKDSQQFLAPQDFIHMSLGMTYCKTTNQSEIFSIGLTVLSAGILKDNFELYNYEQKKFNFNECLIRVNAWKNLSYYSDILKATVELLCAFEPKERLRQNQIEEILFRCQNSIRNRKRFSIYPVVKKIDDKIRENRILLLKEQPINFHQISQSSIKPRMPLTPNTPSKLTNGLINSLNLTQVILGPPKSYPEQRKSQNSESLLSSIDQLIKKRKKSDQAKQEKPKLEKPLARYQLINANEGLTGSLSQEEQFSMINVARQIIVQPAIIIDAKRRSDDIQEEMSPCQTPAQTPIDRSLAKQQKIDSKRFFQTPSNPIKIVDKRFISKSSLNQLKPDSDLVNETRMRVKQSKSHDPDMDLSGRQQKNSTQNSMITMYIPLDSDNYNISLKSSCESHIKPKTKSSGNSTKKNIDIYPQNIKEMSKECSQIQLSNLSQQDKQKIQHEIIQNIQSLRGSKQKAQRRIVKFADNQHILDMSHKSKILQIQDIDLDYSEENQIHNNSDRIFVGYRQPNQLQIVVQSVKISRKNSQIASIASIDQ